jgi:hypothetical protein
MPISVFHEEVWQPNYAFERTVLRGLGAPRARRECAPAALVLARHAAAQRER